MWQGLCVLVVALHVAYVQSIVPEEFSALFNSISANDFRHHFENEGVKEATKSLQAILQGASVESKHNVYVVELDDICEHTSCHTVLRAEVNKFLAAGVTDFASKPGYYQIVNRRYAQIVTSAEHIDSLRGLHMSGMPVRRSAVARALTTEDLIIKDVQTMPAHAKLSTGLARLAVSPAALEAAAVAGTMSAAGETMRYMSLHVTVAAMAAAELQAFVARAREVLSNLRAREQQRIAALGEGAVSAPARGGLFDLDDAALKPHVSKTLAVRNIPVWVAGESSADPGSSLAVLLRYLIVAHASEVLYVEQLPDFHALNRWARGSMQTGDYTNIALNGNYSGDIYDPNPNNHEFNELLTGKDEVIGISDSGIDMSSCYFFDPFYSDNDGVFPYNTVVSDHRKLTYYHSTFADTHDNSLDDFHGTHVAATAAGQCYNSTNYGDFKRYNGHAYNAKIAFFDMATDAAALSSAPGDLESGLFDELYAAGARVMSNSWGSVPSDASSSYSSSARQVDSFMENNPDALVLFAAGNSGRDGASTVNSPSTCKNGLSIAASMNAFDSFSEMFFFDSRSQPASYDLFSLADFSSRGPTLDGRMKPDLCGIGYFVASAAGTTSEAARFINETQCTVQRKVGTSMATPGVAGNAAMVREYFRTGFYPTGRRTGENSAGGDGFIPSGALIKAVLVQAAQPMTTIATTMTDASGNAVDVSASTPLPAEGNSTQSIDYDQGYGRLQLDSVLHFGEANTTDGTSVTLRIFAGAAFDDATGPYVEFSSVADADHTYTFTTDADVSSLRITLAYTDPAGSSGNSALINDLDIKLNCSGCATEFFPEQVEAGQSHTESLEQIRVDSGAASQSWTLTVTVAAMASGPQSYALIASTDRITQANAVSSLDSSEGNSVTVSSSQLVYLEAFAVCFIVFSAIVFSIKRHNQKDSLVHWENMKVLLRSIHRFVCCCCISLNKWCKKTSKKVAKQKVATAKKKEAKKAATTWTAEDELELERMTGGLMLGAEEAAPTRVTAPKAAPKTASAKKK